MRRPTTGVGVDTQLLGKGGENLASSRVLKKRGDWSAVFRGYAGAAVPRLQKPMGEAAKAAAPIPKCHEPGGTRSGSVGTALLDDAHDLQGCSCEHCVPGRRQRRSRGLATTDRSTGRR